DLIRTFGGHAMRPSHRTTARWSVLVIALALVTAACTWPTLGFDAARTGYNPLERTLTAANVGQLQESWSADAPGTTPPVVVGNDVFVAGPDLRVYTANGTTGCSGSPRVCQPVWTAAGTFGGSPTVDHDVVYVSSGSALYAYDA